VEELAVVETAASKLQAVRNSRERAIARHAKPGKAEKRGPASRIAEFAGNPHYVAFKAADKALRAYLRSEGKTLKAALAEPEGQHPEVLTSFITARETWFREKSVMPHQAAPAPNAGEAKTN
jgi:hypothetical protein